MRPLLLPAAVAHPPGWRLLLAAVLHAGSRLLDGLARRLAVVDFGPLAASAAPDPALEFYAEAGAPEGALYLDGQLVGRMPGVTRL